MPLNIPESKYKEWREIVATDGRAKEQRGWIESYAQMVNKLEADALRTAKYRYGPDAFAASITKEQLTDFRADKQVFQGLQSFMREFETEIVKDGWFFSDWLTPSYWDVLLNPHKKALAYRGLDGSTGAPKALASFGGATSTPAGGTVKSTTTSMSAGGSPDVEFAQKVLTALGFDPKGIDGKLGPNTRAAITAFQKKNGLSPTGNLDAPTMKKLRDMAPDSLKQVGASAAGGMSTGVKVGIAVAGIAAVGGLAYWLMSDDEESVEG